MATLYQVPTQDSLQYTLDAAYATSDTTLTLNQTLTGTVQAPGVCVVDRVDSSGNPTSTKRDYFTFTGVSGAQLTGAVGGKAGSTNQVHSVGAIVEFIPDVVWAQAIYDVITTEHNTDGTHKSTKVPVVSGGFATTVTTTASTNVTLPTTGTLATLAGAETFTNKTLTTPLLVADNYAADGGSTDDYVITLSPIPAAYTTGMVVKFKANTINTGAATLNVNSLGAKAIVKNFNVALSDGDIKASQLVEVIYDGTNFQLLSPISNSASGLSSKIITFTRDVSAAGADVSYTGAGFTPTALHISGQINSSASMFVAFADSSKAAQLVMFNSSTQTESAAKVFYLSPSGGTNHQATVKTYDADGFTLTYTKVGSPTGTANCQALCLK